MVRLSEHDFLKMKGVQHLESLGYKDIRTEYLIYLNPYETGWKRVVIDVVGLDFDKPKIAIEAGGVTSRQPSAYCRHPKGKLDLLRGLGYEVIHYPFKSRVVRLERDVVELLENYDSIDMNEAIRLLAGGRV
jgi:hypothetical protein